MIVYLDVCLYDSNIYIYIYTFINRNVAGFELCYIFWHL